MNEGLGFLLEKSLQWDPPKKSTKLVKALRSSMYVLHNMKHFDHTNGETKKEKKTKMGKTIWRRTTKSPTWHKLWLLLFSTITRAQLKTRSINLTLLLIVQLVGVNEGEFNNAGCQFVTLKQWMFIIMHHPTLQKESSYQLFIFELEWSIYFARVYPQKLITHN